MTFKVSFVLLTEYFSQILAEFNRMEIVRAEVRAEIFSRMGSHGDEKHC